jgi:hypothetical protein
MDRRNRLSFGIFGALDGSRIMKPKPPSINRKWLHDKISELLLKKKQAKSMHMKNGKVIWPEWKWLLVRIVTVGMIYFLLL